ncbi:hypothetical protein SLA2020_488070 [Shorea laevis]
MASASANTEKKNKTSSPLPKRGQVKGKIFENLARTVVSAASKVGKHWEASEEEPPVVVETPPLQPRLQAPTTPMGIIQISPRDDHDSSRHARGQTEAIYFCLVVRTYGFVLFDSLVLCVV